jgi:hypothetical protein
LVALAWAAIAEWVAQVAAFQWKDSGFLLAKQLLGAEAFGVAPGQIQRGNGLTEQIPGLFNGDAALLGASNGRSSQPICASVPLNQQSARSLITNRQQGLSSNSVLLAIEIDDLAELQICHSLCQNYQKTLFQRCNRESSACDSLKRPKLTDCRPAVNG